MVGTPWEDDDGPMDPCHLHRAPSDQTDLVGRCRVLDGVIPRIIDVAGARGGSGNALVGLADGPPWPGGPLSHPRVILPPYLTIFGIFPAYK